MALTKCGKCKREWQANGSVEPCPWCRAESAESELSALRQRVEEAEKEWNAAWNGQVSISEKYEEKCNLLNEEQEYSERIKAERDAAMARVERAEESLRKAENWTTHIHEALAVSLRPKQSVGEMVYGLLSFIREALAAAQDAKPDHISQPVKMVSERERNLVELVESAFLEGFVNGESSHIGEPDGYWERSETKATLAALSPHPGGTGEE